MLLLLLVMPVALLLMLMALERYERLLVSPMPTQPADDHGALGAEIPALGVTPQAVPEPAPGFATEVA